MKKKLIIISVVCLATIAGGVWCYTWLLEFSTHNRGMLCLSGTYMDIVNLYRSSVPRLRNVPELDFPVCPPAAVDMSEVFPWCPKTLVSWRAAYASRTVINGNRIVVDGERTLKWRYEEPWNSDSNIRYWNPQFCWGKRPVAGKERPEDFWTNVMGITGPDTAFELQTLKKLDGCGHLIFAVSVKNSGVHWAEPGDLDVRNLPADFREGIDGKGIYALFLDGDVWFIRKDVPMELLEDFLTASRARNSNRYDKLIRYAKELHHGGHFPSYADRCEEYERD